ncbi:cytochrome P450 [Streptomyces sp. NPDC052309]|uniref:cytochrome P450 n=1 Tax=Streptomyces sp. NPDC052309 TaxID=3155421 RepID=UPI0034391937
MTTTPRTGRPPYDPVDISSRAFWNGSPEEREKSFAVLRSERPVSWHPPVEEALFKEPDDPGLWAVTDIAHIREVSQHPEIFSSSLGVMFETIPPDLAEMAHSFLGMDPPKHTRIRKLVSLAFTPKQVARIQEQIRLNAKAIVDNMLEQTGEFDFMPTVAAPLPMRTVFDMMGVPEQVRNDVARRAEMSTGWNDPEIMQLEGRSLLEVMAEAGAQQHQVALEMVAARRAEPTDDLMTALLKAEADGERLTDTDIGAFFVLLAVAGTDTTKQTAGHAMKALLNFPDQRRWLMEDFDGRIGTAVEEFVRWASPVMTFRRTAMQDTVLGGREIKAGDKVVMFYISGNRDTSVFEDPHRFDLSRSPNPHVGFGGGGAHFCLGNQLAKAQLRALFSELLHRAPTLELGEPEYLTGNFVNGIKHLPARIR